MAFKRTPLIVQGGLQFRRKLTTGRGLTDVPKNITGIYYTILKFKVLIIHYTHYGFFGKVSPII
jgi:hypothetical protein